MSTLPPIQAIGVMPAMPVMPTVPTAGAEGAAAVSGASGTDFAGALGRALGTLNDHLTQAGALQQQVATGQTGDPTEAILATQQASIEMQLAVQVRNKLIEGWQELSRMGV